MSKRFTVSDLEKLGLKENPEKPGEFIIIKGGLKGKNALPYMRFSDGEKYVQVINGGLEKLNFEPNPIIVFDVDPIGKPRMTQSDKWKKRDATSRYWIYKDQLKKQAEGYGFKMPDSNYHIVFNMPMPQSWSKKKKEEMNGNPHIVKPDADNILKGLQDCLCESDSHIWDVRITKLWAYKGSIKIFKL